MSIGRERAVTQAFVSLADSLVGDFDVVDMLSGLTTRCAELLDVSAAGLMLADRGVLHVMAASSERTRDLQLFQVQRDEGPCRDCYRSGAAISVEDLSRESKRWPQFTVAARRAGFASVHALPMRLHQVQLGALGLFGSKVGPLTDDDLVLAQGLAHVATVAVVHAGTAARHAAVNQQLQTALASRVVVEQAKGVLAERGGLEVDEAFARLRGYARDHSQRLADVAQSVVSGALDAQRLLDARPVTRPGR